MVQTQPASLHCMLVLLQEREYEKVQFRKEYIFSTNIRRYGYHQRENTGSRLFTEIKPCWMGLISGWVTISIKYPVLYSLGSQAGAVDINHAFHLYYNVVCGSISRSQPDFEGFLRVLRFPPSAKLTPSLIQYAGPHW